MYSQLHDVRFGELPFPESVCFCLCLCIKHHDINLALMKANLTLCVDIFRRCVTYLTRQKSLFVAHGWLMCMFLYGEHMLTTTGISLFPNENIHLHGDRSSLPFAKMPIYLCRLRLEATGVGNQGVFGYHQPPCILNRLFLGLETFVQCT